MRRVRFLPMLLPALGLLAAGTARADRIVLAPDGNTLAPHSIKGEIVFNPTRDAESLSRLQIATGQGIELETERQAFGSAGGDFTALNVQYPLLADIGALPALSLGVRDLLGTGLEHGSFYLAAAKSVPLSDRQARFLRGLKWSAGAGTGRIGGLFVGIQARLVAGIDVNAELYRRRPNVEVTLPVARHVRANATSLDGTVYYGLSLNWAR